MLSELKGAVDTNAIKPYHFNILRSTMEKTASFFGLNSFGDCIDESNDKTLFKRALNLFSHGRSSVFDPVDMDDDKKELFERILAAFLAKYQFDVPAI